MRPVTISVGLLFLLATNVATAAQAEPNDTPLKLKFEMSTQYQTWIVRKEVRQKWVLYDNPPGPIKPTHAAEVLLNPQQWHFVIETDILEKIQESPIAKKLSQTQTEFLQSGLGIRIDDETNPVPSHYSIWIYAVSETDARTSVHAFLDTCTRLTEQRVQEDTSYLSECQERLEQDKKNLAEKEKQVKNVERQYKTVKNGTYSFLSDDEAAKLARETIFEMDKTLDTLDIELAGIREKLRMIEKYRNEPGRSGQVYNRLDEMFVEQMVELSGLESRRRTVENIRGQRQQFYRLFTERKALRDELDQLKVSVAETEGSVRRISESLKKPTLDMLRPKVFQNKVTIYPVRVEE
jgi:hypothetical protein